MATKEQIEERKKEAIKEIMDDYKEKSRDGFNLGEMISFVFNAAKALVEIVEAIKDISGKEKKELVMDNVKHAYKEIDPNIPRIPEPFETWLENIILDYVLSMIIDFIVKTYKEKRVSFS